MNNMNTFVKAMEMGGASENRVERAQDALELVVEWTLCLVIPVI